MAKEIPYFKFYIGDWLNGDITLEDYSIQGVFINICAYYWSKDCEVSIAVLNKKFKGLENTIDQLINANIIKENNGKIDINFLNEQFSSKEVQKAVNRNNGMLGGRPTGKKTEIKPNGLIFDNQNESETKAKANRNITNKEKSIEEESKEDKIIKKKRTFVPPSLEEVEQYFIDNKYDVRVAERAFKYYAVADWTDSKGNAVKSWKQKMQSVWFKEENLSKEEEEKINYTSYEPLNKRQPIQGR